MKFIYADSLDYVDPNYDFARDEFAPERRPYWDDVFAHELFPTPPYDGLLVTRALLGGAGVSGKYTESQVMRFMRDGVREFLRLSDSRFNNLLLFGDCGAFSYHRMENPPYTPNEMVEFYEYSGFSHGCSIDHIVFEFGDHSSGTEESKRRYEVTLGLAEEFINEHRRQGASFTPIGVVQGWSRESMASAAQALLNMGFRYLAIGGLAPLKISNIRAAVASVHAAIVAQSDARIHLLGFAKAEHVGELGQYRVASFDSTSPLLRAFKDSTRNYWSLSENGELGYYTAIRVPQAHKNVTLQHRVKRGEVTQEELVAAEAGALDALREFDKGQVELGETLDRVMAYSRYSLESKSLTGLELKRKIQQLRMAYEVTLSAKPWQRCGCAVCTNCAIEVVIFRASNRNKRRGMHNMGIFHSYVQRRSSGSC